MKQLPEAFPIVLLWINRLLLGMKSCPRAAAPDGRNDAEKLEENTESCA
jgi:hypothetical protein